MTSDSDDDSDYVPPNDIGPDGGSDSEARAPKRARTDASEDTDNKQQADEAFAAFKASLSAPPLPEATSAPASPQTVKIVKRYTFAGEEVTEIKEVPANSPEAKEWPLWKPSDDDGKPTTPLEQPLASHSKCATPTASHSKSSAPTTSSSATPAKPSGPGKRPGPRKLKTTLAAIPKKQPVKKLTTLDKSAMDWRAHVEGEETSGVKDELEANRRGGGYLEKVEFLQRVETRKEEVLDANKGKRRR